jgi:hypothetical protein
VVPLRVQLGKGASGWAVSRSRTSTHPDETRSFEGKGRADVLNIGGHVVGEGIFEPGWKWSNNVKPIAGTEWSHLCFHFRIHARSAGPGWPDTVVDWLIMPGRPPERVGVRAPRSGCGSRSVPQDACSVVRNPNLPPFPNPPRRGSGLFKPIHRRFRPDASNPPLAAVLVDAQGGGNQV